MCEDDDIHTPLLSKQVFTNEQAEKILGWAVANHLMRTHHLTSPGGTGPDSQDKNSLNEKGKEKDQEETKIDEQPKKADTDTTLAPTSTSTPAPAPTALTTGPLRLREGRLVIPLQSIEYGIDMLTSSEGSETSPHVAKSLQNVEAENEFERKVYRLCGLSLYVLWM